jgi:E3 ubiquitin-protein ligase ZNF598
MTQFRELSQLFREGKCFAKSYYEHVRSALGEEGFEEIFPELLVLLPDITKQQVNDPHIYMVAFNPQF